MYVNLLGRDGIVASVSLDQSLRGALYEFERAYLQYQASHSVVDISAATGLDRSYVYRKYRALGVRLGVRGCA